MTPRISVIVPVYKAEKYLHRCVNSILAQTFTDFELILVDDGSPDNSGAICDEYATKDNRIKVIHKENGGVSRARQTGLDNAIGEYVIHADPDDWVEPEMLETLYNKAKEEDADMVFCDFYIDYKYKVTYEKQNITNTEHDYILRQLLLQKLHGSCCNKLVRRSCFNEYNIKFPENIIRWEDLFVNCNLLLNPIRVSYLPKAFYHYDQIINSYSIVRIPTKKGVESQIIFCNYFQDKLLLQKEYDDCIYRLKAATKELAYKSRLYEDDYILELYSEINNDYISKKYNYYLSKSLSLLIRNRKILSKILYWYGSCIEPIRTFVKNCVCR